MTTSATREELIENIRATLNEGKNTLELLLEQVNGALKALDVGDTIQMMELTKTLRSAAGEAARGFNSFAGDLTAIIKRDGDMFVAQSLEMDIASQGRTPLEAMSNLAEAVALAKEVA